MSFFLRGELNVFIFYIEIINENWNRAKNYGLPTPIKYPVTTRRKHLV